MSMLEHLRYPWALAILLLGQLASVPIAAAQLTRSELIALVPAALSPDRSVSHPARLQLREAGPIGLEAMFIAHAESIKAMRSKRPNERTESELRLREAIEHVAQQLDVEYSQLYWFTDLERAKAEAQRLNRPILSLRMLGKLTDELSCANSRFFRTSLYPNPAVADLLRKRFVLHWSIERPVPKMTIDFGDGRVLHTTVTGNSIHYILDSRGRVFDGLPGLYTPYLFKRALQESLEGLMSAADLPDAQFLRRRSEFHRAAARKLATELPQLQANKAASRVERDVTFPPAAAISKTRVEAPLLDAVAVIGGGVPQIARSIPAWEGIATSLAPDSQYEPPSIELMLRKFVMPAGITTTASPILRALRLQAFQSTARVEAVRNEYSTHAMLHQYLQSADSPSLDAVNEYVYTTLFGMPQTDRWLGLLAEEVYGGVEGYGLEMVPPVHSLS